jgi:hypothetical protein
MAVTSPQIQQHDDPISEAQGRALQALAVLMTVSESTARWATAGAQNRARKAEREATNERLGTLARQQADRLGEQARIEQDRALMDRAFDDEWLAQADLHDIAELWRTATMYAAAGDPRAREAMRRAEGRLRELHPTLMDAYDRNRAAGQHPADAMRAAAYSVWEAESRPGPDRSGRPHGNVPGPASGLRAGANGKAIGASGDAYRRSREPKPIGPGGPTLDALDAAVRAEVVRLAAGVDPEALDQMQRQWRSSGNAPAADAAGLLAQYAREIRPAVPAVVVDELAAIAARAEQADRDALARGLSGRAAAEQRDAQTARATPDHTATPLDEHTTGLITGTVVQGRADSDRAAAAAQGRRMSQAFTPLVTLDPLVAGKQPAQTVSAPIPRKGRIR